MKFKILGPAVLATLALMAFATTASATTLEIKGVKQAGAVTTKVTLEQSLIITTTGGSFANTCSALNIEATTTTFTGTSVSGPITSLAFEKCTEAVVVDSMGNLSVENIAGTTNGTLHWTGAVVTMPSPFGALTCRTAASPGTDLGTETGVASGNATIDLTGIFSCGFPLPSAHWEAKLRVTSPEGLGVTS